MLPSREQYQDEVAFLLADLVRFDTSNPPGNETPCALRTVGRAEAVAALPAAHAQQQVEEPSAHGFAGATLEQLRCEVEGKSPNTLQAYGETLGRFAAIHR